MAASPGPGRVWRFDQETDGKVVQVGSEPLAADGKLTLTVSAVSGTIVVVE